jgi:hypothetical protein
MIIRTISRKTTVCQTCNGSMSIDEDEDGLHLKCTMCSRVLDIRLQAIMPPSDPTNPTFQLPETGIAGAD